MLTGATGFVGSHTAAALVRDGHEVRALVRSADKLASIFGPRGITMPEVVMGDVTDEGSVVEALTGCDAVIHTAGIVAIDKSREAEMVATNVEGTRNVLGKAVDMGLGPVVYTSSVSALFPPPTPTMTPDSPIAAPENAYGRTKAEAEAYARELQDAGLPVITVYPGGVMGPDDPVFGEVMRALVLIAKGGVPHTTGGFLAVDVRDVAAILVAALKVHEPRRYMAGGHFQTWPEVAANISSATGRGVLRWPVPPSLLRGLGKIGDSIKRIAPFSLPLTHEAMNIVTNQVPTDDSATVADLGVDFRPVVETYRDSLRWLVDQGHLSHRFAPAVYER